ncbi:Plasmodium vivax Vir protein, putative [Plasmodium vivax]|uniref:Vir protein, putative n=1 Tax=Plasmodium vivax TaxID=5855 RepID=A0A1G4HDP1_PLAVI|nr:Plasmodium vivax Vir protein, putative [Plasmodium vivax]
MDIEEFIKAYPFLNNMVSAYNSFNDNVNSRERSAILSILDYIKSVGGYKNEDQVIYEKLIRNLWSLSNNIYKGKRDYCIFLNQWLYLIKKKYKIIDYPIDIFYGVAMSRLSSDGRTNICPFYIYDNDYEKSTNIIKLQNFYNNIDTIAKTLMNESIPQGKDSHYCYAQRYANECVNIYKNMYDKFCSDKKDEKVENKNTCFELNTFYKSYTQFLFIKEDIKNKIPNLASGEIEKHFGCPYNKPAPGPELIQESGQELGMGAESGPRHGSVSVGAEKQNNPTKFNSTAVVGTMAGIPPFLVLIYKFTPVGTLFRSKNKKGINAFNHLDEEIENELFYGRHGNATTNFSPERYNVAYGPV